MRSPSLVTAPHARVPQSSDMWTVAVRKTIVFSAPCRNGHQSTYTYSATELRELLQSASLRFHCNRCVATRAPTAAETLALTNACCGVSRNARDAGVVVGVTKGQAEGNQSVADM